MLGGALLIAFDLAHVRDKFDSTNDHTRCVQETKKGTIASPLYIQRAITIVSSMPKPKACHYGDPRGCYGSSSVRQPMVPVCHNLRSRSLVCRKIPGISQKSLQRFTQTFEFLGLETEFRRFKHVNRMMDGFAENRLLRAIEQLAEVVVGIAMRLCPFQFEQFGEAGGYGSYRHGRDADRYLPTTCDSIHAGYFQLSQRFRTHFHMMSYIGDTLDCHFWWRRRGWVVGGLVPHNRPSMKFVQGG